MSLMSVALHPSPLPVAQVLDSALRVFRACVIQCMPYGVLVVIAAHLPQLYNLLTGAVSGSLTGRPAGWWAVSLVSAVLGATFWNATLLRLDAVVAGRRAGVLQELKTAARRAPWVLLLILLLGLVSAILALPALQLPVRARPWGFTVTAIAVIYLGVMVSCSWVGVVLQKQGVLQSLATSVHLVRGNWWRVAAVYSVGAVMLVVFAALGSVLVAIVVPLIGRDDLALISSISEDTVVALCAVAVPFCTALPFTLFEALRARQSGGEPAVAVQ
jgi:hypothetical protein